MSAVRECSEKVRDVKDPCWCFLNYNLLNIQVFVCPLNRNAILRKHGNSRVVTIDVPLMALHSVCKFHFSNITKRSFVLVLPRKNAPVYQGFTLGTLKNLVCHVWWALQYLALRANINFTSTKGHLTNYKPEE